MNSHDSKDPVPSAIPKAVITLSPWINERFPPLEELLTAHDVARLTRRPRWLLTGLSLLGRFPRKHRYRGRSVGWLKADVVHWISHSSGTEFAPCRAYARRRRGFRNDRQQTLPFHFGTVGRVPRRTDITRRHYR